MAVKIGHAGSDENGNIAGGKAGDQTGNEVYIRDWWAMGWTHLLRAKRPELAEQLAENMEKACRNDCIGYGQDTRLTLYYVAKAVGFDLEKITTPCNCDCSSLEAVTGIAAGLKLNPDLYTGNMVQAFEQTGEFEVLTAKDLLTSSVYLKRGDILVKQYYHTCTVLTNGSKITDKEPEPKPEPPVMYAESFDKKVAGSYEVKTALNLRCGAGTGYKILTVLPKGAIVRNYGYYTMLNGVKWLYVQYGNYTGFCSSQYLTKKG